MNAELEALIPALAEEMNCDARRLVEFFGGLEDEADNSVEALEMVDACDWIVKQRRSPPEKARAMAKLFTLPKGPVHISSMQKFCGWSTP